MSKSEETREKTLGKFFQVLRERWEKYKEEIEEAKEKAAAALSAAAEAERHEFEKPSDTRHF